MKLNLSIIAVDIKDLHPSSKIRTNRLKLDLDFAALYDPSVSLQTGVLYIAQATQLEHLSSCHIIGTPAFLCIGEPPSSYLESTMCNIVWVDKDITANALLMRVSSLFFFYNQWHLSMQTALIKNTSIRDLGELSSEIFRKPLWLYDRHYQTIFHVIDCDLYTLPEDYASHDDMSPWPLWEVNAWKDGDYIDIDHVINLKKPYILPNTHLFSYRSLACNMYVGEQYAATITIDEVDVKINDRDFALLYQFSSVLSLGVKRMNSFNLTSNKDIEYIITDLLERKTISSTHLISTLKYIEWKVNDPFICLVAKAINDLYTDTMLVVTASKTCSGLAGVIYGIEDRNIVFIVNTRLARGSHGSIVDEISERLQERRYQTKLGISTVFGNLQDLRQYYVQALEAINVGEKTDPQKKTPRYYFKDYMLTFIIEKCRTNFLPEALAPQELMTLINYDKMNDSDLTVILKTYLENNMQTAETSRQLFMHRNTLINKIKKMEAILDCDLTDPYTRLLILLALKILDI